MTTQLSSERRSDGHAEVLIFPFKYRGISACLKRVGGFSGGLCDVTKLEIQGSSHSREAERRDPPFSLPATAPS